MGKKSQLVGKKFNKLVVIEDSKLIKYYKIENWFGSRIYIQE